MGKKAVLSKQTFSVPGQSLSISIFHITALLSVHKPNRELELPEAQKQACQML